ncbi:hypothetical protein Tco_0252239 [Tanacetum coccineum]
MVITSSSVDADRRRNLVRVQQMMKGSDIGNSRKEANCLNEWESLLPLIDCSTGMNKGQDRQIGFLELGCSRCIQESGSSEYMLIGNDVAARAEGQTDKKGCCLSSTQLFDCSKEEAGNPNSKLKSLILMRLLHQILMKLRKSNAKLHFDANLQQASTSGTQTDVRAPVYDSDGSAEVHNYDHERWIMDIQYVYSRGAVY